MSITPHSVARRKVSNPSRRSKDRAAHKDGRAFNRNHYQHYTYRRTAGETK